MKFLLILLVTTIGGPFDAVPSTALDTAFYSSRRACQSAGITAAAAIATLDPRADARWHCLPVEP